MSAAHGLQGGVCTARPSTISFAAVRRRVIDNWWEWLVGQSFLLVTGSGR